MLQQPHCFGMKLLLRILFADDPEPNHKFSSQFTKNARTKPKVKFGRQRIEDGLNHEPNHLFLVAKHINRMVFWRIFRVIYAIFPFWESIFIDLMESCDP